MEPGVRHGIRPGTKYKGGKTTDLVEQVCFCVAKRGPLPVEHPALVTQGHDAPETMHLKRLVGYEVHLCVGRAAHQSRGDFLVGDKRRWSYNIHVYPLDPYTGNTFSFSREDQICRTLYF